jgi:hypothetical protein
MRIIAAIILSLMAVAYASAAYAALGPRAAVHMSERCQGPVKLSDCHP